jgi:hypothetical protein
LRHVGFQRTYHVQRLAHQWQVDGQATVVHGHVQQEHPSLARYQIRQRFVQLHFAQHVSRTVLTEPLEALRVVRGVDAGALVLDGGLAWLAEDLDELAALHVLLNAAAQRLEGLLQAAG